MYIIPFSLALVFILAYFVVFSLSFVKDKETYEIKTKNPKNDKIKSSVIFFVLGIIPFLLSGLFYFLISESFVSYMLMVIGLYMSWRYLVVFNQDLNSFVAIKGSNIYYRVWIKTQCIPIQDLIAVRKNKKVTFLLFKNHTAFATDNNTIGLQELFNVALSRKKGAVYNLNNLSVLKEDEDINYLERKKMFEELAKEYKASMKIISLKQILQLILNDLWLFAFGILFAILLQLNYIIYIIYFVMLILHILLNIYKVYKSKNSFLNINDEFIGLDYYFSNKKSKGYNKYHFFYKVRFYLAYIVIGILFVLFSLGYIANPPLEESELVYVEGYVDYDYTSYKFSLNIYLIDSNIEYRVDAKLCKHLDENLWNDLAYNQKIKLLVNPNEMENPTINKGISWKSVYGIATSKKEYLTYQDYLKTYNESKTHKGIVFYSSIAIIALNVLFIGVTKYLCIKNAKKETLELE